jgi:hypothetical protein
VSGLKKLRLERKLDFGVTNATVLKIRINVNHKNKGKTRKVPQHQEKSESEAP